MERRAGDHRADAVIEPTPLFPSHLSLQPVTALSDQSHRLVYSQPPERSTCFALTGGRVASFPEQGVQLLPGSMSQLLPLSHVSSGYVVAHQLGSSVPLAPIANLSASSTAGFATEPGAATSHAAAFHRFQPVCPNTTCQPPSLRGDIAIRQGSPADSGSGGNASDGLESSDDESDLSDGEDGARAKVHLTSEQLDHARQAINDVWITQTAHKQELRANGITWNSGSWTKREIELLSRNIQKFLQENGYQSPQDVIFCQPKDRKWKEFYRTIGQGLNRPLFSIYRRVQRMYDKKNYLGKYSTADIEKLKKLHTEYGSNWAKIGDMMGRSASSVKDRFRLISKPQVTRGRWTAEEEDKLLRIVHDVSSTPLDQPVTASIAWSSVADRMPNRSSKQCRAKWINFLSWKERQGSPWTRQNEIELIEKIFKIDAEEETELDWVKLAEGWDSVRSSQWLRSKWWMIKRHVPVSHGNSLRDMVAFLHSSYAKLIQKKARNTSVTSIQSEQDAPPPTIRLMHVDCDRNADSALPIGSS